MGYFLPFVRLVSLLAFSVAGWLTAPALLLALGTSPSLNGSFNGKTERVVDFSQLGSSFTPKPADNSGSVPLVDAMISAMPPLYVQNEDAQSYYEETSSIGSFSFPDKEKILAELFQQGDLLSNTEKGKQFEALLVFLQAVKLSQTNEEQAMNLLYAKAFKNKTALTEQTFAIERSHFAQSDLYFITYFGLLLDRLRYRLSAQEIYQAMFELQVPVLWLYWRYSQLLLAANQFRSARNVLEKGLLLFPYNEDLVLSLLQIEQYLDSSKTFAYFDKIAEPYVRLDTYLVKAKFQIEQEQYDKALKTLDRVLSIDPKFKKAYNFSLQVGFLTQNYDLVQKTLVMAEKNFPNDVDFYLAQASYYEALNDASAAANVIDKALRVAPKNNALLEMKVRFSLATGDYEQASRYVQWSIQNGSLNINFYIWLSQYYAYKRRYYSAEKVILSALNLYAIRGLPMESDDSQLIASLAEIEERLQDYQKTETLYRILRSRVPDNFSFAFGLARSLSAQKKYEPALVIFAELETMLSTAESAEMVSFFWESYCKSLIENRNFSRALDLLSSLSKDYDWAYGLIALVQYNTKNYFAALGSVNKALVVNPQWQAHQLLELAIFEKLQDFLALKNGVDKYLQKNPRSFFWNKNQLIADLRLQKKVDPKLWQQFLNRFGANLVVQELTAFMQAEQTNIRSFDPITQQNFKEVVLGIQQDNLSADQNLQPYFVVLADVLSVYPQLLSYDLPPVQNNPELNNIDWMLVYQAVNPSFDSKNSQAVELLRQAAELNANNPNTYGMLVDYLISQENYEAALLMAEKYREYYPNSRWLKMQFFLIYESTDQDDLAHNVLQELLQEDPQDPNLLNNQAWFFLTTQAEQYHDVVKALDLAKLAVEKNENPAYLDTLAEAYYQNRQYEQAIESIEKALILDTREVDHYKRQFQKIEQAWKLEQEFFWQ